MKTQILHSNAQKNPSFPEALPYTLVCDVLGSSKDAEQVEKLIRQTVAENLYGEISEEMVHGALQKANEAVRNEFKKKRTPPVASVMIIVEHGERSLAVSVGDIRLYGVSHKAFSLVAVDPYYKKTPLRLSEQERRNSASNLIGLSDEVKARTDVLPSGSYHSYVALPYIVYEQLPEKSSFAGDEDNLRQHLQEFLTDLELEGKSIQATLVTSPTWTAHAPAKPFWKRPRFVLGAAGVAVAGALAINLARAPSSEPNEDMMAFEFEESLELQEAIERLDEESDVLVHRLEEAEADFAMLVEGVHAVDHGEELAIEQTSDIIAYEPESAYPYLDGSVTELQQIFDQQLALESRYQELLSDYAAVVSLNSELRETLGRTQQQLQDALTAHGATQGEYRDLVDQYAAVSERIESDAERVQRLQITCDESQAELASAMEELQSQRGHVTEITEALTEAHSDLKIEEERYAALLQEVDAERLLWREEVDGTVLKMATSHEALTALNMEVANLKTQLELKEEEVLALDAKCVELGGEVSNLQNDQLALLDDYQSLSETLVEQQGLIVAAQTHSDELEIRLGAKDQELAEVMQALQETKNDLYDQSQMAAHLERELESKGELSDRFIAVEQGTQELREALASLEFEKEEVLKDREELLCRMAEDEVRLGNVEGLREELATALESLAAKEEKIAALKTQLEEYNAFKASANNIEHSLASATAENSALLVTLEETKEVQRKGEAALQEKEALLAQVMQERSDLSAQIDLLATSVEEDGHLKATTAELEEALSAQRERALELEQELSDALLVASDRGAIIAQLESEYAHHEEMIDQLQRQKDDAAAIAAELQIGASSDTMTKEYLEKEVAELSTHLAELRGSLAHAEQSREELTQELDLTQNRELELANENLALADRVAHLEQIEAEFFREKAGRQEHEELLAQLNTHIRDQRKALASAEESREELSDELTELKALQGSLMFQERHAERPRRSSTARAKTSQRTDGTTKRVHIVSPGESLMTIARRYQVTVNDLYQANSGDISDANQVRIGTALVIPQ